MNWAKTAVRALIFVVLSASSASSQSTPGMEDLSRASSRGLDFIRREQHEDGSWTALIVASSVRYNLYTIYLYEYLGMIEAKRDRVDALMRFVWSQVNPSGGVPGYPGATDDLDLSVQAYIAARMAGESEDAPRMKALALAIENMGGISEVGGTARPYLWLFDLEATGSCVPGIAVSQLLNFDDQLPWVRVMAYPFAYLLGQGRIHPLSKSKYPYALKPSSGGLCRAIPRPFRNLGGGKKKFFSWVHKHLNDDGTMFDYSPTSIPTLMALATEGARYRSTVIRGVEAIEGFQAETPDGLYQAPGEASVAETYVALETLLDLGVPATDPVVRSGERFLLSMMQKDTGAFGFSKHNEHFPDTDDTANAIATLHELAVLRGDSHAEEPFFKGLDWLVSQQNDDGGFGTWEKEQLPWLKDLFVRVGGLDGFVLSESVVEHTARVALTLNRFRHFKPAYEKSYRHAIDWLLREQRPDGGYFGTWFINRLFGTAMVAAALGTAGGDQTVRRAAAKAVRFVLSYQASDGGFSESPASYETGKVEPLAKSSPAQTGLIVSQLLWYLENEQFDHWHAFKEPIGKAIEFLARTQEDNGRWNDGTWTGVTFPKVEYLIYPYVQDFESLHAIGRYRLARELKGH